MKNHVLNFISSICLVLFFISSQFYINIKPFNSNNVISNIRYLSSNSFKGRLAGTFENREAASYIKSEFIKSGLDAFDKDYFHNFNAYYPCRIGGTPYLKITHSGNTIKEYRYGIDYKEDMTNFKKNQVLFDKKSKLLFSDKAMQVTTEDDKFIFIATGNDSLDFRSSFNFQAFYSMYILITSETLMDLQKYINKGYSVECFIPFENRPTTLSNVTAYIEGKNPIKAPIVISAHFDHVGTDLGGQVYNGALDNASGISFVMEMARYLSSLSKPERSIIFVGFNAEELGCVGSKYFANEYSSLLKSGRVYNFDMIGSNSEVPLCIMGGKKDSPSAPLIKSAASSCSDNHVYFNYIFDDSSDHEGFRKENIDAITLIDHDLSRIHTSNDKADYISAEKINRCYKVIWEELIKNAYNSDPILLWYKDICIISFLSIVLIIIIKRRYYKTTL